MSIDAATRRAIRLFCTTHYKGTPLAGGLPTRVALVDASSSTVTVYPAVGSTPLSSADCPTLAAYLATTIVASSIAAVTPPTNLSATFAFDLYIPATAAPPGGGLAQPAPSVDSVRSAVVPLFSRLTGSGLSGDASSVVTRDQVALMAANALNGFGPDYVLAVQNVTINGSAADLAIGATQILQAVGASVAIASSTPGTPAVPPGPGVPGTPAVAATVTTAAPHGLTEGENVVIAGHLVNTGINGQWYAHVLSPTVVALYVGWTGDTVGGNVVTPGVVQTLAGGATGTAASLPARVTVHGVVG